MSKLSNKLENIEEEIGGEWLPVACPQPETPTESMEFLARSWSVSAKELSMALCNTHDATRPENEQPDDIHNQVLLASESPPESPRGSDDAKQWCAIPIPMKEIAQNQVMIMNPRRGGAASSSSSRRIKNNTKSGQITDAEEEVKLAALSISFNIRLRSADMAFPMQERALRHARALLDSAPLRRPSPSLLARSLKKEFDSVYGPAWHCVVGTSFGSFVTHSPGGFLYFSVDSLSFLLFKTEVHVIAGETPS